jgi:hypothetical protein
MKKLLIALFVMPLVGGCMTETIVKKVPPPGEAPPTEEPGQPTDPTTPTDPGQPTSSSTAPEDRCLDGQDMDGADVDVAACPAVPTIPDDAPMADNAKDKIDLGAWELGTAANGATYVYGTLSAPGSSPRTLSYDGGSAMVNDKNLECWAKGYYRLRKILQNPPAEYVALRKAGFQYRFFQFQTDLRNGPTGYKEIASFQDHLVKWVTVITAAGVCQQPTATKFKNYAKAELTKRGIAAP